MFPEFFTWWSAQLASLLPARLIGVDAAAMDALVIDTTTGAAPVVWRRQAGRRTDPGPLEPTITPGRVVLRVADRLLLEREIDLPLAVERDWRNVLRYELGRLTPFAASDIFWTGAVIRRDVARGKIVLRLSLVPKATVAGLLAALDHPFLIPTAIEVVAPDGVLRTMPITEAPADAAWQDRAVRGLTGLCAGLALVAIALPFIVQTRRIGAVDHRIALLRPVVAHAEALRRRISTGSSSIEAIARERAKVGDPLAVLAAVTRALPDNTFLTELTLRHLKLDLAGHSTSAPPLLAALSSDKLFDGVAFSAPVTRDTTDHADIFAIKAKISPTATRP